MASRVAWGSIPPRQSVAATSGSASTSPRTAEQLSRFSQPSPSEGAAQSSTAERRNAHMRAVEGHLANRSRPLPIPVLQTRESEGHPSGQTRAQQPLRPRSPFAAGTALDGSAGARRPSQSVRSRGPDESLPLNGLSRAACTNESAMGISPSTSTSSVSCLEPRKAEPHSSMSLSPNTSTSRVLSLDPRKAEAQLAMGLDPSDSIRSVSSLDPPKAEPHPQGRLSLNRDSVAEPLPQGRLSLNRDSVAEPLPQGRLSLNRDSVAEPLPQGRLSLNRDSVAEPLPQGRLSLNRDSVAEPLPQGRLSLHRDSMAEPLSQGRLSINRDSSDEPLPQGRPSFNRDSMDESFPQGRLSLNRDSIVNNSTSSSLPPRVSRSQRSLGESASRNELSLSSEGIKKHLATEYILPRSPPVPAAEGDLDPAGKSHSLTPTSTISNWALREVLAERLSETPAPGWAKEAQVRELKEEQARQAHVIAAAESRLGEEIGTLKEAVAAEAVRCEQMEARINKRCTGLVEEEAAVRRAVESHLEARLSTMRSEVMTAVRAELKAYAQEFALIREAVDQCAKRAAAAAVAVEASGQPAARDPELDAGGERQMEVQMEVLEKPERERRSRSPKKRPSAMQPLQEQPNMEHLARLDEAIEREMRSRADLEQRLEVQLQAVSAEVRASMAMMQSICAGGRRNEELKLQEVPAKDVQPLPFPEAMAKATPMTLSPGLDSSNTTTSWDQQAQTETLSDAISPQSERKQTGEEILRMLTAASL